MTIGGGGGDQYVVYATFDGVRFFTLVSRNQSQSKIRLFIGGQEGDYPTQIVVDRQLALAAAKRFASSGEIDQALQWGNGSQ
jgi:Immunity protein Imm1